MVILIKLVAIADNKSEDSRGKVGRKFLFLQLMECKNTFIRDAYEAEKLKLIQIVQNNI